MGVEFDAGEYLEDMKTNKRNKFVPIFLEKKGFNSFAVDAVI